MDFALEIDIYSSCTSIVHHIDHNLGIMVVEHLLSAKGITPNTCQPRIKLSLHHLPLIEHCKMVSISVLNHIANQNLVEFSCSPVPIGVTGWGDSKLLPQVVHYKLSQLAWQPLEVGIGLSPFVGNNI